MLGEGFFQKILPFYFREVPINQENVIESILYIPLYLKRFQSHHNIEEYLIELIDYEYIQYQVLEEAAETPIIPYNQTTTEIYLNPIAQAIRHEFDIHEYVVSLKKNSRRPEKPKHERTLLLMSKSPTTKELTFLKGNIHHAAIIDELHDGKILKKGLLQSLHNKYPKVAQSEWVIALKTLRENYITLES